MHNNTFSKTIKLLVATALGLSLGACSSSPNADWQTAASDCATAEHTIAAVQGEQMQSPMIGQLVSISGVVTASWQAEDELGGFFLQDDSAGIFVNSVTPVAMGDRIAVEGVVAEQQQLTQLTDVLKITTCGTGEIPAAKELRLPVAKLADFEALEGQLVHLPQELVVNGTYLLGRHGSFDVAPERLYTPTQIVTPGTAAQQLAASYELKRLVVDDNKAPQPAQVNYPAPALSAENTLRTGDTVLPMRGILSEYNGRYRLQPTSAITFQQGNPRPEAPARVDDDRVIRIATFNVLNYFNGNGPSQQFPTDRGAETRADFLRQEAKIIAALIAIDADIIGLMELENDGYQNHSAVVRLVNRLRTTTNHDWRFIQAADDTFGGASITNGLIYRGDRVTAVGGPLTVTTGPFSNRSRYPLIQRFQPSYSAENFAVAVNHFKSKGSCPRDDADPNANQGDGQACWNAARTESARLLVDFMSAESTLAQTPAQVLLGDFNAYAQEDPLQIFAEAGYHNRIEHFEPQGYSYVYDAQAGSLDHILVSDALHGRVLQQQHWLVNADEPTALGYDNFAQQPNWYAPSPYRSSDHDPVIIDLQF
ncbi:ExeM/NucH family extracellular endonuclease [Pseudidiomarina sp. CB1]|uniref:ExeM/NucH family extracellular endonuclease n=1 Tax=Pseudidiomarina sp. CB1 TaxID=2972484 RepID=UPI002162FD5F|nr:ExeM/NucH family extracellular endonuclease [Pseudidiomarina sp. CB1]